MPHSISSQMGHTNEVDQLKIKVIIQNYKPNNPSKL
jgi:hypothetical protein